jgi:hypothetical protein
VLLGLLLGLLAARPSVLSCLVASAARVLLGLAGNVGGARLGGLDYHPDLLGGRSRQGLRAPGGGQAQLLHLDGDGLQVCVHRVGLVPPAADGEISLLDVLAVDGQAGSSRSLRGQERGR